MPKVVLLRNLGITWICREIDLNFATSIHSRICLTSEKVQFFLFRQVVLTSGLVWKWAGRWDKVRWENEAMWDMCHRILSVSPGCVCLLINIPLDSDSGPFPRQPCDCEMVASPGWGVLTWKDSNRRGWRHGGDEEDFFQNGENSERDIFQDKNRNFE